MLNYSPGPPTCAMGWKINGVLYLEMYERSVLGGRCWALPSRGAPGALGGTEAPGKERGTGSVPQFNPVPQRSCNTRRRGAFFREERLGSTAESRQTPPPPGFCFATFQPPLPPYPSSRAACPTGHRGSCGDPGRGTHQQRGCPRLGAANLEPERKKGGSSAGVQGRVEGAEGFPVPRKRHPTPHPAPPPTAAPAAKRGLFDNCGIYLANKFADQLILVTAALPQINYSEFKYNHWLIPTSSGPRLAIHPC